jgi:O-antigen/teichoic acid export membrane protein
VRKFRRLNDLNLSTPLTNKTLGNAAMMTVGAVGEALLQFLFIVIASRELGPEEFGFYGYLLAIFSFVMVVVQFGLPVVLVRELTGAMKRAAADSQAESVRPSAVDNRQAVIFAASMRIRLYLAVGFLVLAVVASLVDADAASRRWAVWLMFVSLLYVPYDLAAIFDSRKLSRWDVPGRMIGRTVSVALLAGIWLFGEKLNLTAVAACSTINLLINALIGWQIARRLGVLSELGRGADRRDAPAPFTPAEFKAETRRLLKMAAPIMWANLMTTVYLFSQTILVKWLSTDLETGYYALASRLILPMVLIKGILYRLILPLLSEVSHDRTAFTGRVEKFIAALCLFFMPAVALAMPACELLLVPIFGPEYAGAVRPSQISLSHLFVTGMGSIFGTALFALGYQRTYTISLTVGCAVCLGLGSALIPVLGADGASWATVAAECSAVLVTLPPFLQLCRPKVGRRIVRIALGSMAGAAIYYALVRGFDVNPWLGFAAAAAGVAAGVWASGELSAKRSGSVLSLLQRKAG